MQTVIDQQSADLSLGQNWQDLQTLLLCYHMKRVYGANAKSTGEAIKASAWKLRNATKDQSFFELADSLARAPWHKAKTCIEKVNTELKSEFSKQLA